MCPARLGAARCPGSPDHFGGVSVYPVRCAADRGAQSLLTASTSAVRDVCVLGGGGGWWGGVQCHSSFIQLSMGTCVLQM